MAPPKSVQVACICGFSAIGSFLFGMDMGYIGPIIEDSNFKRDVAHLPDWDEPGSEIDSATSGFIVSIFALGCVFSSFPLVSGFFLDRLGRKVSLMTGSLVFVVGAVVQAACSSISMMLVGRFIAGCSIGILSTVVPLYQSELAPPQLRGGLTALHQVMVVFGATIATFADALLLPLDDGWRLAILMPVVPGLVLFVGMFFLPRSPRWLVQHGEQEAALSVLQSIREEEGARSELQEIILDQERDQASGGMRWADLFSGRVVRLLAVGIVLQLLQQATGICMFVTFGPRIFQTLGFDASLLQTLLMAAGFVAVLPAMYFIERFGRKTLLLFGAIGMLLPSVVMAALGMIYTRQEDGKIEVLSKVAGSAIVACIFFFCINFAYSWGPTTWVYCAEIFPLKVRGYCVGLTTMAEWAGAFIINQLTPTMLSSMGFGAFAVTVAFNVVALLFVLWLPETKGVLLEHMDQIFDKRFGKDEAQDLGKRGARCPSQKMDCNPTWDDNASGKTSDASA
mmetsp:Transcript_43537/g.110840  ORF Transcript_43537/g.110840 Transcript_43537/m.110840 type:complete len:510 (+) Transcript_43537:104-1633(+)